MWNLAEKKYPARFLFRRIFFLKIHYRVKWRIVFILLRIICNVCKYIAFIEAYFGINSFDMYEEVFKVCKGNVNLNSIYTSFAELWFANTV